MLQDRKFQDQVICSHKWKPLTPRAQWQLLFLLLLLLLLLTLCRILSLIVIAMSGSSGWQSFRLRALLCQQCVPGPGHIATHAARAPDMPHGCPSGKSASIAFTNQNADYPPHDRCRIRNGTPPSEYKPWQHVRTWQAIDTTSYVDLL